MSAPRRIWPAAAVCCLLGMGSASSASAAGAPPGFPTGQSEMKCNTGPPTPSGIPGIPPTTHGDPPYATQLPCRIQTELVPVTVSRGRFSRPGDSGRLTFENESCGAVPALHLSMEVTTGTPGVLQSVGVGTVPASARDGQFVSTTVTIPSNAVPGGGLLGSTVVSRCRDIIGLWAINGVPPKPPAPAHHISISFSPSRVPASGNGLVDVTITDQDQNGAPVAGADVTIEPPIEYGTGGVPTALVCDSANRLVSPFRLNGGSALGKTFVRTTDGAGQIHVSLYVGTLAGNWLIDAYEAGNPGAPRSSQSLSIGPGQGPPTLPDALTSLLIAAGNSTLANFAQSGQRNVLEWLGQIAADLPGIGFAPIYGIDATGVTSPGVVLFADNAVVRGQVLSYLDGLSSVAPDDTEAVVIDVRNLQQLLLGTRLAGHLVNQIPYRLPSLSAWSGGTVIQIADPDVQAFGNSTHIPIPARGRARFGLLGAIGNEPLLYGYGPSPPFAGGAQPAAALNHCVGGNFNLTTIVPHSPISVMLTRGDGSAGVDAHGQPVDTLPGAVLRYSGGKARSILAPNGRYRLTFVGTGAGPATLVLTAQTKSGSATRVFSFSVRRRVRGTIALSGSGLGSSLRLGHRVIRAQNGLRLFVHGLPSHLTRRRTNHLALRLLDQFGQPAAGVAVTISGAGARRMIATTDAHGALRVGVRPTRAGAVALNLSGPGYLSRSQRLTAR